MINDRHADINYSYSVTVETQSSEIFKTIKFITGASSLHGLSCQLSDHGAIQLPATTSSHNPLLHLI